MKTSIIIKIKLLLVLTTVINFVEAQTYKGIVKGENGEPVLFANVVLYTLPDSIFIGGTTTTKEGEFLLKSKKIERGYLEISCIGFKTITISAKEDNGVIILKENVNELGEVVVSAGRKIFKVDNEGILATVKNTVLETFTNANEVIAQLPFLNGKDGDFTVFGRGVPVIYINNRQVRDNKELEQLSPTDIKNIKVITSPGANYGANIKAVINITTEKRVGEGLSGMLYLQGKQASVFSNGEYVSLNYRKEGWDIFASAYYNNHNYKTNFEANQYLLLECGEYRQLYKNEEQGGYNGLNSVIGFNFNPNKEHSAGIRYNNNSAKGTGDIMNDITYYAPNISEIVQQNSTLDNPQSKHSINGYYNGKLSENFLFNFNTDVVIGNEKNNMTSCIKSEDELLKTQGERDYTLYAIKGVIAYNLKKATIDMGGEYSNTRVLQSYKLNNNLGIENTNDKALQHRSALFISYKTNLGQIGIKTGIRYENIILDYYENEIKNKEQSKQYNKFFPNLSLSYVKNNINTVIGYQRKVCYPTYKQLRSNIQYSSPFIYESGNPFLLPQIENQLSAMFAWKSLQGMIEYSIYENSMQIIAQQFNNQAVVLLRDENVKQSRNLNIGVTYSPTWGIWRPQFEIGGLWQWLKLPEINHKYDQPIFMLKCFNTLSLPKKWVLGINTYVNTSGYQDAIFTHTSWGTDLKITKKFMKDKLSVSLIANDIFNSNINKWKMDYEKINLLYDKNIDSRSVILTVSYKFNTTKNKYKGQQATDEINRL